MHVCHQRSTDELHTQLNVYALIHFQQTVYRTGLFKLRHNMARMVS
jgi:hypothetical protein